MNMFTADSCTTAVAARRTSVYRHALCTLVAAVLCWVSPGSARQLDFSHKVVNTELRLGYRFEAALTRSPTSLSFALPTAQVRKARQSFRRFNPRDLERRWSQERRRLLERELVTLRNRFPDAEIRLEQNGRIRYTLSPTRANEQLRRARARDIETLLSELRRRYPHVRIRYHAASGRVEMSGMRSSAEQQAINSTLSSRMHALEEQGRQRFRRLANQADRDSKQLASRLNQAIDRVYATLEEFKREYLKARYYTLNSAGSVQPDYARIARESLDTIEPVARAWAKRHPLPPTRAGLNKLLGFFQSIPYDTLESRYSSEGAGFAMPAALLARNRGDCDTKSVAMASLVHALAPDIATIMVLLSDHALLGFAIEPQNGDRTLEFNGRTYVLAEPVGPALQPLGNIGKSSRERTRHILQLFEPAALPRG